MKSNRTKKLSVQLFSITFVIMVLIIAVIMIFQFVFFDKFYESYRKNQLKNSLDEAVFLLENDDMSYSDYVFLQGQLMFNKNAFLFIHDVNGNDISNELKKTQEYYLYEGINQAGENIEFILSEEDIINFSQQTINYDYDINCDQLDKIIEVGASYNILYSRIFDNVYDVNFIENSTEDNLGIMIFGFGQLEKITITNSQIASDELVSQMYVRDYATIGLRSVFVSEGLVSFSSGYETINISQTVTSKTGVEYTIIAEMSLESTKDAAYALATYSPYFFMFAFTCALLVAYIYSKKVAKPIAKISMVASDMSRLDFDKKIDIEHNNEIGILATSLNSLSANLQNSIEELKSANSKLEEDIRQKEKQEQIRKEFVANVSHELKTPLGVMQCYLESLNDGLMKASENDCYTDMLNEVSKMKHIIMEMLEISKIESGDMKLDIREFKLGGLIDDNVTLFELMAKDKGMTINASGEFMPINADYNKMDSVMRNLIGNAVKYGEPYTNVLIKGERCDKKCRVSIINKCSGITQTVAEQFFLRFYTQDKSRNNESTGLGLSICKAILDAHSFDYGIECVDDNIEVWFEYDCN